MAKLAPFCRRDRTGRRHARRVFVAAVLGLTIGSVESTVPAFGGVASSSGWRVSIRSEPRPFASASLLASRTASRQRDTRASLARLDIRCGDGRGPGVFVSFPAGRSDRANIRYRLDSGPVWRGRLSSRDWLGARGMIRDLARADVLVLEIEDPEFGSNKAVFRLAGVQEAARRVLAACDRSTGVSSAPEAGPPSRGREARPRPAAPQPPQARKDATAKRSFAKEGVSSRTASEPPAPPDTPSRTGSSTLSQTAIPRSAAPARTSKLPAPPKPATPADDEDQLRTSATRPSATDKAPPEPSQVPRGAAEPTAKLAPATPPPPSADVKDNEPKQSERLAAFLQRHGPNRKGEPMYDWYKQCLAFAGIDIERVWYLSNEELTYLNKGESDEVRLSMLISTSRNLDIPPRRIVCHGTARQRHLTITKAE